MANTKYMITTIDNPFDPFDQFSEWNDFDAEKGYYTCSKLARLADIHEGMTQVEEEKAMNDAIDKLIDIDFMNIYKRVSRELEDQVVLTDEIEENGFENA